jgi:hypothetical protein
VLTIALPKRTAEYRLGVHRPYTTDLDVHPSFPNKHQNLKPQTSPTYTKHTSIKHTDIKYTHNATMSNEAWKEALPKGVQQYHGLINENWENSTFDTETITPKAVNGYILQRIIRYATNQYVDTTLWEIFREDFEDWTIAIWKEADKEIIRDLRNQLRRYGVNVRKGKDSGRIMGGLRGIIDDPIEPKWSQEDIEYQLRTGPYTSTYDAVYNHLLILYRHGPYVERMARETEEQQEASLLAIRNQSISAISTSIPTSNSYTTRTTSAYTNNRVPTTACLSKYT